MELDRQLKNGFGEVSKEYDLARASYPNELIEQIIKISKINQKSKIFEIGCGSGKATHLFAEKGFSIFGIDISKNLINIAKQNTSLFRNATYQEIAFEEFISPEKSYDLIISAQAWHWLNPEIAYQKAYDLLKDNGYLALFWKTQEYEKLDFLKKLRQLYLKHCPKYHRPIATKSAEKEIKESGLFSSIKKNEFLVELEYNKEKYAKMVSTMSWVIALSKDEKAKFNLELLDLLNQQNETFSIPVKYTLLIARKYTL